jgi:putative flippase GtrA
MLRDLLRQFLTFCGVGVVNTAAGLGTIFLLSAMMSWHYMLVNAAGYGVGLLVAFTLHRSITFRASAGRGNTGRQMAAFLALFAVCYGVQLAALYVMVGCWHWPVLWGQICAIVVYTAANFFGNRFFVFHAPKG